MLCSTIDCNKPRLAKGLCSQCYWRVKRGGTPELSKKQQMALRKCSILGCLNSHSASGLCDKHYMKCRRKSKPEIRIKEITQAKAWRKNNPENFRKLLSDYRKRNKARLSEYYKEWRAKNRAAYNSYQKSRKKRVKQSTPKWADLEAIRQFYFNCPPGFHVDHIIPITGDMVCGLHVLNNLQYLPALENLRKGNRLPS